MSNIANNPVSKVAERYIAFGILVKQYFAERAQPIPPMVATLLGLDISVVLAMLRDQLATHHDIKIVTAMIVAGLHLGELPPAESQKLGRYAEYFAMKAAETVATAAN